MRVLADESCDGAVVRAMREAGHDVTSVRDTMRGASDRSVLDAALSERRLLLTEDKDFGELVFARGAPALGVLLLRYAIAARSLVARRVIDFVALRGKELDGSFVVIAPSRTGHRHKSRT
jgi:predicted nuclease of predicted toxin-antitoxin system